MLKSKFFNLIGKLKWYFKNLKVAFGYLSDGRDIFAAKETVD